MRWLAAYIVALIVTATLLMLFLKSQAIEGSRSGGSPGQSQVVHGSSLTEIDVQPTFQQRNAQVRELIPVIEAASRELDAPSASGAGLQPLRPQ
jgi:hypothetical protein